MAETLPRWRAQAWVTAPGEFPSQSLQTVEVSARIIEGATTRAKEQLGAQAPSPPVIVSVERIDPPADQQP